MFNNRLFVGILFSTAILQILIVQFGSVAFKVAEGGLSLQHWALSLFLGALSLIVQQIINVLYFCGQWFHIYRTRISRKDSYGKYSLVDQTTSTVVEEPIENGWC